MAQNSINNSIVNAILSRSNTSSGQWDSYDDGTDEFGFYNHAGSPEGNVTANIGSLAVDTTNGAAYIKTTDSENTGWSELLTSSTSSGEVVQVVYAETATQTTTAAQIPDDNSIPQITEGEEVLTVSITPKNSNNLLYITTNINMSGGSATAAAAIFRSDEANALLAMATPGLTMNPGIRETAGTTNAISISLRIGSGDMTNVEFNTGNNSDPYGGVRKSSITVMEVQA